MQDFNLQNSSPCIDAGDPDLPLDPDDTISDMGAVYYHQASGIADPVSGLPSSHLVHRAYPNPFNPHAVIAFTLPAAGNVNVQVYDLRGNLISRLADGWLNSGSHEVLFDASQLATGLYVYRINAGVSCGTGKVLLMK